LRDIAEVNTVDVDPLGETNMDLTDFAGQNWLITPAASAVGEPAPASVHDQKWLLVLTGIVTADLQSTSDWQNTNLSFLPDLAGAAGSGPLNWAIRHYGIPTPETLDYAIGFAVDEWAPFVSQSAIFNIGLQLKVWRPNHFATGIDAFNNTTVGNIFTGINVDVRLLVINTDDQVLSLGYNITLRGRIVFTKVPLFKSNFDVTMLGQPPASVQAAGTATSYGPVLVEEVAKYPGQWLELTPNTGKGAVFTGIFQHFVGPGVYTFSATMILRSKSTTATIGFVSNTNDLPFLTLNFATDSQGSSQVDVAGQPTGCLFLVGEPFSVQVTLAVGTSSADVQVVSGGIVASLFLPQILLPFVGFTFSVEGMDPLDVKDILVTFVRP
jgi:hypothetical protein